MGDKDADVRDWATFGLGSLSDLDSPEIREAFAIAINDTSEDVKQEALVGMARRRDHRALPYLFACLQRPQVDDLTIEAACEFLRLPNAPDGWGAEQCLTALHERFG
jgi:HEAT repeat protein